MARVELEPDGTFRCRGCDQAKPLNEFPKATLGHGNKFGIGGRCLACGRERARAFYEANPSKSKEYSDRKRAKPGVREVERQRSAEWKRRNPDKVKEHSRRRSVRRYGLTLDEYDRLLTAQGGVCAICQTPPGRMNLSVDHCHTTGAVRGLLCGPCNVLLGMGKENPAIFAKASEYLTA